MMNEEKRERKDRPPLERCDGEQRDAADPHPDLRDELAEGDDHGERDGERHPQRAQGEVRQRADAGHHDQLGPQIPAEADPDRMPPAPRPGRTTCRRATGIWSPEPFERRAEA
jgi:hypothetical protein